MSRLWDIVKHRLVQYQRNPLTGKKTLTANGVEIPVKPMAHNNLRSVSRSLSDYMDAALIGGYGNRTYRMAITVPANFVGARLIMRNPSLVDIAWTGAIYMAPSSAPTGDNPTGSWTRVTFDSATTFTIPAGRGNLQLRTANPSRIKSDWIPVQSVARADSTVNRVLYVSGYAASSMANLPTMGNVSQPAPEWRDPANAMVRGRTFECRSAAGDLANSGAFAGLQDEFGNPFPEVEFLTLDDVLTLAVVGDSLTEGDAAEVRMTSPGHFAALAITDAGKLCISSNYGVASQNTNSFLARLKTILALGSLPDIVVFSAYSPNDFAGDFSILPFCSAQMYENAVEAINLCARYGVKLVLTNGMPNGASLANDAHRVAYNARLVVLCATNGILLIDYSAVMSDPSDSTNMAPSLRANEIHPNVAGYTVMGNALAAGILASGLI